MLNNVISILILNQFLGVDVQFGENGVRLLRRAVLEDPLNHSTAVGMCAECKYLSVKCINDELQCNRFDTLDALLNDMISILIFYTCEASERKNSFKKSLRLQFYRNFKIFSKNNLRETSQRDDVIIYVIYKKPSRKLMKNLKTQKKSLSV